MQDADTRIKYFLSKRNMLCRLRHPNIVEYLDFDEDPDQNSLLLYMEFCILGDLEHSHKRPHVSSERNSFSDASLNEDEDDLDAGFYAGDSDHETGTTRLDGPQVWALIYQVSSALAYLHYGLAIRKEAGGSDAYFEWSWKYVIHRDVKPANGKLYNYVCVWPNEVLSADWHKLSCKVTTTADVSSSSAT